MKEKFWKFKAAADGKKNEGSLFIYGEIVSYQWDDSDTTAQSFKKDLDALGDIGTLHVYVNSPGGSVFEGVAIHNILKRHKAKINIYVDGLAASIASVIAMAGDTIHMPENSMMMVHNPWTMAWGNATDFRKAADDLDRIGASMSESYLSKAGDKMEPDTLKNLLDNETWLSAKECFDYGFCDVVGEANQAAACVSEELFAKYRNVPEKVAQISQRSPETKADELKLREEMIKEARQNAEAVKTYLGGITL
ncbi:head maturation protease, ClpP-related [Paenibacillus sp. MBLB4367]|uniref:head maturation protease, ClpP-related n=1 Tax=Paenibacillus sp. MBLB4367 TaxID=3384767 RepID=UPI0039082BEE